MHPLDLLLRLPGDFHGVGGSLLEDAHAHARHAVQSGHDPLFAMPVLYLRDVGHAHGAAVNLPAEDGLSNLIETLEFSGRSDDDLSKACGHPSSEAFHVGFREESGHLRGGQTVCPQPTRVQQDPDLPLQPTYDLRAPYARYSDQPVLKHVFDPRAKPDRVHRAGGYGQIHDRQLGWVGLEDQWRFDVRRQTALCQAHLGQYVLIGHVHIRPVSEGHIQRVHPFDAGGFEGIQIIHRAQQLLQRLGNVVLDLLGRRPLPEDLHLDDRIGDVRQKIHLKLSQGVQAEHKHRDHQQRPCNGTANGQSGKIHGVALPCFSWGFSGVFCTCTGAPSLNRCCPRTITRSPPLKPCTISTMPAPSIPRFTGRAFA